MNTDSLRAGIVLGTLATVPFLFGANGKGCQPLPLPADGGVADAAPDAPADDASTGPDATPADAASPPGDSGACVSGTGGPCGGFTQTPCSCAPGNTCEPNRIPDIPGTCVVVADAACVDNVLCIAGDHWDPVLCTCVPDSDASPATDAASPTDAGAASDAACVDNVLCILGDHWDPALCKCVPTTRDAGECTTAADCHGALPQLCVASCDGGPGRCAHFVCKNGACETAICD